MKRIIIIGSGGAGKSTLARRLGEITGIEVIHLDKLHWKPNWTGTPKDEWRAIVEKELKKDAWVMDGNFGGTLALRLAACDTVIYLDFPRAICLYRALKRVFTYYNKTRPDMGEGCRERLDFEFLHWVWTFPSRAKPEIEEKLKRFASEKNVVRLHSPREIENFLAQISRNSVIK